MWPQGGARAKLSFVFLFFKDCWCHSHSSTSLIITKDFHVFLAVSLNSPRFAANCSKLTKSWPKPSLLELWFLNTFLIILGSWSVQTRMLVEYANVFQQQSDGVKKKSHLLWVAFEPWLEHSSTCLCKLLRKHVVCWNYTNTLFVEMSRAISTTALDKMWCLFLVFTTVECMICFYFFKMRKHLSFMKCSCHRAKIVLAFWNT